MSKEKPEDRIWNASIEAVEATGRIIDKDKWEVRREDFMAGYSAGYTVASSIVVHCMPDVPIKLKGELVNSHTAVPTEEEAITGLINLVNIQLFKTLAGESDGN